MIVAVAEDSRGAEQVRPWIEQAKPTYWSLIDLEHRVASLYGMVNVPRAVWIDEEGRIVRPPETAGSTDHFRRMDAKTQTTPPPLRSRTTALQKSMSPNPALNWRHRRSIAPLVPLPE